MPIKKMKIEVPFFSDNAGFRHLPDSIKNPEDEHDYMAFVLVTMGTEPYFDKEVGHWLPGDPAEAEILGVEEVATKTKIEPAELTEATASNIIEETFNVLA